MTYGKTAYGRRLQSGDRVVVRGSTTTGLNQIGIEVDVDRTAGEVVFVDDGYNVALVCYENIGRPVAADYVFLSVFDLVLESEDR